MNITWLVITFVIMLVGLLGILIPFLPDTILIFIAALIYAIITQFKQISPILLLILAGLTVLSYLLDYVGAYLGAKKFGSTKWGAVGGVIGAIMGFFIYSFPGLFIFAVLGTILFEIIFAHKDFKKALKGGTGTFIGLICGIIGKIIIALIMIGLFIQALF